MPDTSDILKDPTAYLEHMRSDFDRGDYRMAALRAMSLHASLAAGGRLPRQWLADGVAAGHLAVLVRSEAVLLMAAGDANDKARGVALMRALQGLGMEVE